jgi:hypothetical protein
MKKAIALIITLFTISFTFAQSSVFVSLQQDYETIIKTAESLSAVKLETNANTVFISNQESSTRYFFNEKNYIMLKQLKIMTIVKRQILL